MEHTPEIVPPWDDATVRQLNRWQTSGRFHPFTCPNDQHGYETVPALLATTDGWICPFPECGYAQYWAHAFMADPRSLEIVRLVSGR